MKKPSIDCQACGDLIRELSLAEAQQVADNPYNFIWFCKPCEKAGAHIEPGFW